MELDGSEAFGMLESEVKDGGRRENCVDVPLPLPAVAISSLVSLELGGPCTLLRSRPRSRFDGELVESYLKLGEVEIVFHGCRWK